MKIPILMYHSITKDKSDAEIYSVDYEMFRDQMEYLHKKNYRTVLIDRYIDGLNQNNISTSSQKEIILTFDDGHLSDYQIAFPVLKSYNFTAHFFVVVDWVGKEGYLNWEQLKEMAESNMSIQSHTLTHPFLSDLSLSQLFNELKESKEILEQKLQRAVNFLSLPGGRVSNLTISKANLAGYKAIFTSIPGIGTLKKEDNILLLKRLLIMRKTSFRKFLAMVEMDKNFLFYLTVEERLKNMLKKAMGNRIYHFLWRKLYETGNRKSQ